MGSSVQSGPEGCAEPPRKWIPVMGEPTIGIRQDGLQ